MDDIRINAQLIIPHDEVRFTTARSGGPGGQHVNTTDSRVTLYFSVDASGTLTAEQKAILKNRLRNRINGEGELLVTAQDERSQLRNRQIVIARFSALVAEALKEERPRRPTRPTAASARRRLQRKRIRKAIKASRRRTFEPTD